MFNLKNSLKKKIRAIYLAKRKSYSAAALEKKSFIIRTNLEKVIYHKPNQKVMFYYPIYGEVNVLPTIEKLLINNSQKVFLPKIIAKRKMEPGLIKTIENLKKGLKNILEPISSTPEAMDVVIVPGLAFTTQGDRLGYGGGYYDYYLKHYPPKRTIGVFYFFQKLIWLPKANNDIKINSIITEKTIVK